MSKNSLIKALIWFDFLIPIWYNIFLKSWKRGIKMKHVKRVANHIVWIHLGPEWEVRWTKEKDVWGYCAYWDNTIYLNKKMLKKPLEMF